MTKPTIAKNFCTTREAAARLGISLRTAQLWVESGLLTAWKTSGGHRRITIESVEKLLVNPAKAQPDRITNNDNRPKVLVVEDDRLMRELYRSALTRWAATPIVNVAENGFEGLIRIGQQRPDVLISDLNMPGMDGFEMLRTLASLPDFSSIVPVVITGMSLKEIGEHGSLPTGMPILHKPVSFQELEKLVMQLLYKRDRAIDQIR